jgi:hypothetical protein
MGQFSLSDDDGGSPNSSEYYRYYNYPGAGDRIIVMGYSNSTVLMPTPTFRKLVDEEPQYGDQKKNCEYCHGHTQDDSCGNCCACGAPRKHE